MIYLRSWLEEWIWIKTKILKVINKILLIILNIKYIHHRNISYVIMAWLVLFLNNYDLNKIDSYRVVHR